MISMNLRVTSIRSQNPLGFGGCIFTAQPTDCVDELLSAHKYIVVKASGASLGQLQVDIGQWWIVRGVCVRIERKSNDVVIVESQINVDSLELVAPAGRQIIDWISDNRNFRGIGRKKATDLWNRFQENLYTVFDSGDYNSLAAVLSFEHAVLAVQAWQTFSFAQSSHWLYRNGFDCELSENIVKVFESNTRAMVELDPYRLLSFCAGWTQVDVFARKEFGLSLTDSRRIRGAVEEVLYRKFQQGHTRIPLQVVKKHLKKFFGNEEVVFSNDILSDCFSKGSFRFMENSDLQLIGPWIMESAVARTISARLGSNRGLPVLLPSLVDSIIEYSANSVGCSLNSSQRLAVHSSNTNLFSLISEGARHSAAVALNALYKVFDYAGIEILQVTLSGPTAKFWQISTGRTVYTLAQFITRLRNDRVDDGIVLILLEASNLDISMMFRLCEFLPLNVRIVMCGDDGQVLPSGPGSVFHNLVHNFDIPKIELSRTDAYNDILSLAAQSVYAGNWPNFEADISGTISFVICSSLDVRKKVIELYANRQNDTQIIAFQKGGLCGTKAINVECQRRFTLNARRLEVYLSNFESYAGTGFHLGDRVVCTRDREDLGLYEGALGRLDEIFTGSLISNDLKGDEDGDGVACVAWDDGQRRNLFKQDIPDFELGYAVTVDRAQGDRWPRVIVALCGDCELDRAMIYSAMTRANDQLIFVGDLAAAQRAVQEVPDRQKRMVGMSEHLRRRAVPS